MSTDQSDAETQRLLRQQSAAQSHQLFGRKISLLVLKPGLTGDNALARTATEIIDLSAMHIQFKTANQDEEGPSNCSIRVFNLKESTVERLIRYDFSRVVLQAGYEGAFGVIFDGNIKQFRVGRLNATDTYLDILAADGDLGYNFGVVNTTLAASQTTPSNITKVAVDSMKQFGVTLGQDLTQTGGVLPRGKVMFGMARLFIRNNTRSLSATWSIQNGKVTIIPLETYLPGEAVLLTSKTGLIGLPEQTQDGIKARCLLNPKIVVGGRVKIDNKSINQTISQGGTGAALPGGGQLPVGQIPFDKWTSIQNFADVNKRDGTYRVYVCEHEGDTRGTDWYSNLTCLNINNATNEVVS